MNQLSIRMAKVAARVQQTTITPIRQTLSCKSCSIRPSLWTSWIQKLRQQVQASLSFDRRRLRGLGQICPVSKKWLTSKSQVSTTKSFSQTSSVSRSKSQFLTNLSLSSPQSTQCISTYSSPSVSSPKMSNSLTNWPDTIKKTINIHSSLQPQFLWPKLCAIILIVAVKHVAKALLWPKSAILINSY